MQTIAGHLRLSASDLVGHVECHHLTALDAAVACGSLNKPKIWDPVLYSLNRLNVATSRAKCLSILVCSPALFEPECKTPAQMKMANALCRYLEMAGAL